MKISYLDLKKIYDLHAEAVWPAVSETVKSGRYLYGSQIKAFEEEYSRYIGSTATIGVASGLDALKLILRGYIETGAIRPGSQVIVPANTFIASVLAVTECGLEPVLVDPDPTTFNIDAESIEKAVTDKTSAVMIVHLYGRCAYSERISEICRKYSLKLIEDNAQGHGCTFKGKRTGSLSDAAGHSFYPGKNLGALADAGAVTTNDTELEEVIRSIANYGGAKKYHYTFKGVNSRMDEIQAAVLRTRLKFLDHDNSIRKRLADIYLDKVSNPHIQLPFKGSQDNVWHIFPIFCKERDRLSIWLGEHGVGTLVHYPVAIHKQECFRELSDMSLPVTENICRMELSLPLNQAMTKEEVGYISDLLNSFE